MNPEIKAGRPLTDETPASGHIHIRVTLARKNAYVKAAKPKKLTEWIFEKLDKAASLNEAESKAGFATRMLAALKRLTNEREQHSCGGFTTDDMQWQMGIQFTTDETLWEALDELTSARLIRYCGYDEDDATGTCYELVPDVERNF